MNGLSTQKWLFCPCFTPTAIAKMSFYPVLFASTRAKDILSAALKGSLKNYSTHAVL
jgi:hypothetical protein